MATAVCNTCGAELESAQHTQCSKCWLTGLLWEKFALDPVERDLRESSLAVYNEDTGYYEEDGFAYPRGRSEGDTP